MKKIIITGIAGLIGSRFAEWVLKNHPNYRVIGIDDLSGGYLANIPKDVFFYKIDLSSNNKFELQELKALFSDPIHPVDYVFHFAAYAAEGLSPFMRHHTYSQNILPTVNIINNCIEYGVKRLVYTSSSAVYGMRDPSKLYSSEEDQPAPIDPYGIAKYACEMDIKVAGEQHGLDWCILRPHNVYGPGQNIWDPYRNVLGIWMYNVLHKEKCKIYGDGSQTRYFTYIDDILPCIWKAATEEQCSKEIINLGGKIQYSIAGLYNVFSTVLRNTGDLVKVICEEPRWEIQDVRPFWEKSEKLLDFKHITQLADGIGKMWEWAKIQPNRIPNRWNHYEVTKGLYSYWK